LVFRIAAKANKLSSVQDFVGMRFDFDHHTVALAPKFIAKLPTLDSVKTCHDFESLMGKLLYAGAVLNVNWRSYYWLIKYYRRILSLIARNRLADFPLRLAPSAQRELCQLYDVVRTNQPVKVRPPVLDADGQTTFDAVIASDATPTSGGGLLLRDGHLPEAFGARWPDAPLEINYAETVAAACLLERFAPDLPRGAHVLLLIDNTSAKSRILNACRSTTIEPDGVAQKLIDIARQHGLLLTVRYIASAANPADRISRMKEADPELIKAVMNEALGRRGTRTCVRVARGGMAPRSSYRT
jgi:hypothetical protein